MTPEDYLSLPVDDEWMRHFDWSEDGQMVVSRTLTWMKFQSPQIAGILDGVFSGERVPHFGHVLLVLQEVLPVYEDMRSASPQPWDALQRAFLKTEKRVRNRNLGRYIALLCESVPGLASSPTRDAMELVLERLARYGEKPMGKPMPMPMPSSLAGNRMLQKLQAMTEEEIQHWLTYGIAPVKKDARLATAIDETPPLDLPLLTVLKNRERLKCAVAIAPALDAAMALPPRKMKPSRLPVGGYSGVINRGIPERLLPSQFALEPDDFIRRFAENELLYFRREDPHEGEKPERWLILDQGVRTWGPVRIALAGAVVAALGRNRKRAGDLKLALSAFDEEAFDPLSVPADTLADRLETSAMHPHPARALRQALRADCENPQRDILLLTHPRCWTEPELLDSLDLLKPGDRCFALFVNEDGSSELAEWRGEGLIRVRKFKVDLDFPEPKEIPATTGPQLSGWTGDIEPIGFPFRPGLVAAPIGLCFDAAGEHVVVLGKDGVLQLAKLDGSPVEVLPRPAFQGHVFTAINTVGGVADGFAACGMMYLGNDPHVLPGSGPGHVSGFAYAAAYYDLKNRTVKVHPVASLTVAAKGWYLGEDFIGVKTGDEPIVIELHSSASTIGSAKKSFAKYVQAYPLPWPFVPIMREPVENRECVLFRYENDQFRLCFPHWNMVRPLIEGKPLLANKTLDSNERAQFAYDILAWVFKQSDNKTRIHFFKPPGERFAEHELVKGDELFHLSPTGKHIAIQKRSTEVEIYAIQDGLRLEQRLSWAALHNNLDVIVNDSYLCVSIGVIGHWFDLAGSFRHKCDHFMGLGTVPGHLSIASATETTTGHDTRFGPAIRSGSWSAVSDTLGQVILRDAKNRVAAHFLIRKELAAIVLPDGTKWGSSVLLGGPPSPDAEKRITEAFREARL